MKLLHLLHATFTVFTAKAEVAPTIPATIGMVSILGATSPLIMRDLFPQVAAAAGMSA